MKIYPKTDKYNNLNVVFFKLSKEDAAPLYNETSSIIEKITVSEEDLKSRNNNHNLAGHIEHQYLASDSMCSHLSNILSPVVDEYINRYTYSTFLSSKNLILNDEGAPVQADDDTTPTPCWINFQKKYEFNPVHSHRGIFSFVIWLKIPYLAEVESQYANILKGKNSINGDFCFVKQNGNRIEQIALNIDQRWERRGALFSADLSHAVYPFYTSDDYRISVSGNYRVK